MSVQTERLCALGVGGIFSDDEKRARPFDRTPLSEIQNGTTKVCLGWDALRDVRRQQ